MKKSKKIFLVSLLSIIIIAVAVYYYLQSNVNYQLYMLEKGPLTDKIYATYFVKDNKVIEAIPLLMGNIDDDRYESYKSKVPEKMSCHITYVLDDLTGLNIGNVCNADGSKTDEEMEQIRNSWKDWYNNSYQSWLEKNNNQ